MLDKVTHVLLCVAAVLVLGFQVYPHFHKVVQPRTKIQTVVGQTLHNTGLKLTTDRNLVLLISSSCMYCLASVPFYQSLSERKQPADLNVQVIFREGKRVSPTFLKDSKINLPVTENIDFTALKVQATPTILLLDRNGKVINSWVGLLSPENKIKFIHEVYGE